MDDDVNVLSRFAGNVLICRRGSALCDKDYENNGARGTAVAPIAEAFDRGLTITIDFT